VGQNGCHTARLGLALLSFPQIQIRDRTDFMAAECILSWVTELKNANFQY